MMTQFRALLVSSDQNVVRVVSRCLLELGIVVELCADPLRAAAKIKHQQFNGVVIDAHDEEILLTLLQTVKAAPPRERPLAVVLVAGHADVQPAFDRGAQIALCKPISQDRVRHGLRAARNLMTRQRRHGHRRVPVKITGSLSLGVAVSVPVVLSDLSEGGALLRIQGEIPKTQRFTLSFLLPRTSCSMTMDAEIVWRNFRGELGIQFSDRETDAHRALIHWLKENRQHEETLSSSRIQAAGTASRPAVSASF